MHKYKRGLTSAIALLLCFLTLFSCAFAYTEQQATPGYPQPPTYKGGNNSGSTYTSFTDPVIVGYRFTCWRSTDYKTALDKGLITSDAKAQEYLSAHNERGYKLGHSINIMCNAVTSSGDRRTDYANAYSQTGLKMPHMLTNGEQNDFLDKISTAHIEQDSDADTPNKITHRTATGLMLMDYAGTSDGHFKSNTEESSYFEFKEPLYAHIDRDTMEKDETQKYLSTALSGGMNKRNPLKVYSGYYTRDQWNNVYINTSPENEGEAQNLHTYIYGFQSDSQMGTSLGGYDRSEGVTTISDIDYDGSDVLPFNQNPANVIATGNDKTWTNKNATLIASLCGLTPNYNVPNYQCTDDQFGVYDYIIVEPIMMYYYYYTRYYVTTTDTAILQAQSMRDKAGNQKDVWTSIYYGGYQLFDVCGKFPAVYGTYVYTETPYFGVDGVFNATGLGTNAFQTSRDGLDLSSIKSHPNNKSGNADGSSRYDTYAFVFTTKSGNTLFSGGDSNMSRSISRTDQIRIRDGQNSFFLAPYVAVESLIGTGIFMSGKDTKDPQYQIFYHSNPNSGGANNASPTVQTFLKGQTGSLMTYQSAIVDKGKQPVGKIPTAYWTFSTGNGYGIADNTLNSISKEYPNAGRKDGKIATGQKFNTWSALEDFFVKYGSYNAISQNYEVHLYAAWSTKSLVTTVDRTYDSSKAQTLQNAALYDPSGKMWMKNKNDMPKAISVVATTKGTKTVQDIIQLSLDTTSGYQWFQAANDPGNLDNSNYDYYLVYSFSETSIPDSKKSAVQSALNGTAQSGLMIYRNNGVPVKWEQNVNLFYFDFYTFSVEAPNCSVIATITNYPNKDNTIKKQSSNGVLQMTLPRGSNISYTVTPDASGGYYFDTEVNFAEFQSWENTNVSFPHLNSSVVSKNNTTIGSSMLSSSATQAKYPASGSKEILGKQQHTYTVKTGKQIVIRPWLDGVQRLPFTNYFVDVKNIATGQTYIYAANATNGAITIPANANGIITQAVLGDSQYHIQVTATDQSGRTQMQSITTVNTAEFAESTTVDIHFWSASFKVTTQSGGNHSGITATLYYTLDGVNDIEQAISSVQSERCQDTSSSHALCSSTHYTLVEGVALQGLQLNIERTANSDWYITNATKNGANATIYTNKQHANGIETPSGNHYRQNYKVAGQYHTTLKFAPYHYISAYLNDNPVNVTDIGPSTLANHTLVSDINGVSVWRGEYGKSVTTLSSIVKTDKTHITGSQDALSLQYNDDAVVYTTLNYYTVSTSADNGYSATSIKSVSGTNVGTQAYILSSHSTYKMFTSCATGSTKETDSSTANSRKYPVAATLKSGNTYTDTTITGKLTAYDQKITADTTISKGVSTSISNINRVSHLHWRSNQPRYDLKFVFRINSVPYDSLPETINGSISLDGTNPLTFSTEADGSVVATGKAVADSYNLYLNGIDTGMSYTVTANSSSNVYYIDFYTLRVAAGTGINNVTIKAQDVGKAWNGTLPYYRDGRKFATTLAVWPASVTSSTKHISINATASGEYWGVGADGKPVLMQTDGYKFVRWDTKRPDTNINTTFDNGSTTTTTTRESYVDVSRMNHATVVQAEATTVGTPIIIPTVPEHNSVYYGVKVRTFLDGRLVTPWANMNTWLTPTADNTIQKKIRDGVADWAIVLDLVQSDGKTAVADPYKGTLAHALLAPSKEFETNAEINTEYFYSGSNAYLANQYTYIDAFYYTQTMQTQVNGVNTYPWTVGTYKEVMYRQYYKNLKVDTTAFVSVNDAGAFQTIMMKGMKIKVGGLPVKTSTINASSYNVLYSDFEITGNHAFFIPYYTVDMRAICDKTGASLTCNNLTLTFNGTNMKTSVSNNTPALVMAGEYSITTSDSGSSHSDGDSTHNFLGWDILANEVFILEYVDSGDGKHPYPVLTYTGESRPSTSKLTSKSTASTKINVSDETHLVARYGGSTTYTLTLKTVLYNENGSVITPTNSPVNMYRGDNSGLKYATENGESNKYEKGTQVNVSATLDPQTIYYPTSISVTFKLTCPHCSKTFAYDSTVIKCPECNEKLGLQNANAADANTVYYSTEKTYNAVESLVKQAEMLHPDVRKEFLEDNHVVIMERTASGTYTGTIPYAETPYYLYVNGVKQDDTYNVINNKKKEFVWGQYGSTNNVWSGTAGMNGNSSTTTTNYSDFYVNMDKNREYTVYARQQVTGSTPTNKSLEFVCATIYTSTDYTTKLPFGATHVYINNVKTPLSSAFGHTFMLIKGSNLTISAQVGSNDVAYCDIYNGTINTKKTFLLSYNTVTVDGDKILESYIDGTKSQSETWLANYAIDNGALQSANTTYSVITKGESSTSNHFYHNHSTVTVKTSTGQNIQLVATKPTVKDTQELTSTYSGQSGLYYFYILENTPKNQDLLDMKFLSQYPGVEEQYIVGFSTKSNIPGNMAYKLSGSIKLYPSAYLQTGVKYRAIITWVSDTEGYEVEIVTAEGQTYTAADIKGDYTFRDIANGKYAIYMNGALLVTSGDSITSTTGVVAISDHYISVKSNGKNNASTSTGFSSWNVVNTPGTAATNKVNAGTPSTTHSNVKELRDQLLTGTISYYAHASGVDQQGSTTGSGTVTLPAIVGYKVEVYLDNQLATPFTKPVKFNGDRIVIDHGESEILYSLTFPTVSAVSDSHDPAYSEVYGADGCTSITYDKNTKTFKVYYYSVTYDTDPGNAKWGEVLGSNFCMSEAWNGPMYVAKGTKVTVTNALIEVGNHERTAAPKQVPGYEISFTNWTKNMSDEVPTTITEPTHIIAHFTNKSNPENPDAPTGKEYTVTLYNKTSSFTSYVLNQTTDARPSKAIYHLKQTSIKDGLMSIVSKNAPSTVADTFLYGDIATLTATVSDPSIYSTTNTTTNITLTLTGYTSELAHKVELRNISSGTVYTCNVAANGKVATFKNVPSGKYQLYIDDIKYTTPFSYNTHSDVCKVTTSTGALATPHYETESGAGGIIFVAPTYRVRYSSVSHWGQVRTDRITGETTEYFNLTTCTDPNCSGYGTHAGADHTANWTAIDELLDPSKIIYYFACNECGKTFQRNQTGNWSNAKHTKCYYCDSEHLRMTSSVLTSPDIDENLDYYVYSTYTNKDYAPLNISAEVEMAYPVYVQSVVDGTNQYPFYDNGAKIAGATAYLEYTTDGSTWHRLTATFNDNGLATFYVPMGTSYRIIGATADEFAVNRTTNNIIDGGFSLSKPYAVTGLDRQTINGTSYIVGDGDYDNDNNIDDPGITYYVHYYTVTAVAGNGIDDVNTQSTTNQSKYSSDTTTTVATYQRGATAKVTAAIADGYLPVYITLTKDNAIYTGRTVYLSTSSTTNTQSYKLTYNNTTQRYEHANVFGTAAGTTYYVWADGKVVNGTNTSEYTGVSVVVKPYITPVKWSGNCKHDDHSLVYNASQLCDSNCTKSEANHVSTSTTPFTHSFTVYHTTVEQADAANNIAKYSYVYASEHPTNPSDPSYDPNDPDAKDEYPQNTVYYYVLEVTGDVGTQSATGSGTYLEGQKPAIDIGLQPVRNNVGRTPITVTLYLDNILWSGQTVTIGGYPAKEISAGVYKTDYNFASGTYAITVTSSDITLLDNGQSSNKTVYGYITVSSTRTYTWKAWTDGHVKCSECGVTGACCDTDGTPKQCNTSTTVYCTNCHLILDANNKEQSCCTTGDKKHTWTTCPYNNTVHHGNCLNNLSAAQTTKSNSVTMWHNTKLHGVTTHKDNFTFTGDNTIRFSTMRLYGDAGIDKVTVHGVVYEETSAITRHGTTAFNASVLHRDVPERIWTNTRYETTFFKEVAFKNGQEVYINADLKKPVKNHTESQTALSIELKLDGKPYTGRTVTIGGYAATDADNDGIYVTSYAGFVGGKTYQVTVDGRNAGRIYLESYRSYRWYTWDEPWVFNSSSLNGTYETAHTCKYHNTTHSCNNCLATLDSATHTEHDLYENGTSTLGHINESVTFVARTEIIDEFHVYVDANLNGGPDPYTPPTGDPDDPYKDPTDTDYPKDSSDHWTPGNNPADNANPEYDPNHKPTDNPNYDPVNPGTSVDPSKDPSNFKPNDQTDGFYEDAPVPFYTLTVNTRLNNSATDDFPVKFENLTSGVTIYIIPDGQTYHVYDSTGKQITNVPYIVSMADGTVKIALQDGDKYRISVLDEIEDRNNNDVVDISDIKTSTLNSYTYTTHTEGAISKKSAAVTIDFYTLTLKVYSDGVLALPNGKSVNGSSTQFESPVWLDDVAAYQDGARNWWGETFNGGDDSRGDTGYYAVADANTVKVYLKGQPYDVNVKEADDDQTNRGQTVGTGYLKDYKNGTVNSALTVTVEYFSMTVDHHGGFTGTQINYGGKTHVSATTTAGATGNATAKAFFLNGTSIGIDATVATNNTWYQWTGTATYSTKAQTGITMNQKRAESAWAKTFYTVRYYLHDKSEGWYEVAEDRFTSTHSVVIDNRNWSSVTVTSEPNKYVNFDPFRTHSYSDPTSTSVSTLRDVLTNGVNNTTIDVVINANQVGGQSFVDFYYTRNGSKVDPTPDTPVVPPVTQNPEEPVNPTPQKPEDWNPDTMQEYVTITYVMNGGKYNNSSANYSETHLAGTDITLITPTPPAGQEFVGWFLTDLNGTTQSASGLIGTGKDHYLLCTDTVVYAVYVGKTDLGITANDIYGSIKTGSQFTSSATIVNHNKLSVTPTNHINAVLTIKKGNTVVDTITIKDVIAPGNGTQMISTVVDTTKWDANATYTLTWSLDFSNSIYVDKDTTNNQSSLNSFKPNTYSSVVNTARPGYSTDRPSYYDKDIAPSGTSNTAFYWEYWTWNENSGYNGTFSKQSGKDKMNIVIMLTPENESGLRTYTTGAFGMHNYTTRSGYGLSMHRVYNDLSGVYKNGAESMSNKAWAVNKSHITVNSTVGTLEALMTFPEFNYGSTYKQANGAIQDYIKLTAANAGTYYSLTMPQYSDYETDDYNDQFAHYTPMWLPNGEYIPVTHISGVWTPIGELRATVQQGQYTNANDMHKYGVYTNEVIIKGSLFDDLYNNP